MQYCEGEVVVLLTVYNRMSVEATVRSVLNQSYSDFKLLIVDNASDDGTYELLEQLAKSDNRICLIRNDKNMGQTYSLHKGMSMIKAKYIARIDADDLMDKDRLLKQFNFLEQNPEYGFCGSWIQLITDDDRKTMVSKTCTTDIGLRMMQRIMCGAYHPAVMMRKKTIDDNNLMYDSNLKMAEDYDMWRQILSCSKGLNLNEVLTFYRRGSNNDSKKHQETTFKEAFIVRRRVLEDEGQFPNKELMVKIINIEEKEKKSIYEALFVKRGYENIIKDSIPNDSLDYQILNHRIKFFLIGTMLQHNKAIWARFGYEVYSILRRARYALYRIC